MEKFEIHDGEHFKVIDPKKFCIENKDKAFVAIKVSNITARQGFVGEEVTTILKNGMRETENIVSYDTQTGEPDWIVTQATGEQMIVTDSKFKYLYNSTNSKPGTEITPVPQNRPIITLDESVCFVAPWGELQYIKKGGKLICLASNNIYGIQADEFNSSYKVIPSADAKEILDENLLKIENSNKPKMFISIAYPYDDTKSQEFMKEVIRYINEKGILAINVRKINDKNVNLVAEISKNLENCEGILSLAFNKGEHRTSPFIHIETSLATAINLANLMLIPKDVKREGVLFEDNLDGNIVSFHSDKSLFSPENKEILEKLDNLISQIFKRFKYKLSDKSLSKFKNGLLDLQSSKETRQRLVEYIKAFYQVKNLSFYLKDVFVKRPTQIKAMAVEKAGVYETQDGLVELKAGDYLVMDINEEAKPYSVKKEQFEARYIKVNGEENLYITKLIPVIAKINESKVEITSLIDTTDIYSNDIQRFNFAYQTLEDYIKNIKTFTQSTIYENDLTQ